MDEITVVPDLEPVVCTIFDDLGELIGCWVEETQCEENGKELVVVSEGIIDVYLVYINADCEHIEEMGTCSEIVEGTSILVPFELDHVNDLFGLENFELITLHK